MDYRCLLSICRAAIVAACALLTLISTPCDAQVIIRNNGRIIRLPQPPAGGRLFSTDRETTKRLNRAKELIERGEHTVAIGYLQRILDASEDYYYRPDDKADDDDAPATNTAVRAFGRGTGAREDEDDSHLVGVKREVERIIGAMPEAGRTAYELEYGQQAAGLLEEGVGAADLDLVEQAARRFFHTKAGCRATILLGDAQFDRGSPLAAALHYERLRSFPAAAREYEPVLSIKTAVCWMRAKMPDRAKRILADVAKEHEIDRVTLAGRQISFGAEGNPVGGFAALAGNGMHAATTTRGDWPVFQAVPSRNPAVARSSPIWDLQWQRTLLTEPESVDQSELEDLHERLTRLRAKRRTDGKLTLPAAHPVVSRGTAVFRTLGNLRAVDVATGDPVWEAVQVDPLFTRLYLDGGVSGEAGSANSLLDQYLTQRAFDDLNFGTIAADDRYVYAVEESGMNLDPQNVARGVRHPLDPPEFNKLMAFELSSGKFVWEIGGATRNFAPEAADTFFLGPPLPLDGRLYVLGEIGGEIRLLVYQNTFDLADGGFVRPKLLWKQSLVEPSIPINYPYAPVRRMSGVSPSWADGVLVCPTTAGAVVAVDVARRQLLWGYRYEDSSPDLQQRQFNPFIGRNLGQTPPNRDEKDRWVDAAAVIVDGRVLLTPRDSDDLHCLNLADGKKLWTRPRGNGLYLAAAVDGQAVVVGKSGVQAYNLTDGKPAWKKPATLGAPAGRGVRSGTHYHLPLATEEIATVDLATGRVLARTKTTDGEVPGNLLAVGGSILSQSQRRFTRLTSLDEIHKRVEETLTMRPDDANTVELRGRLRLQKGERKAGLADLRRALEIESTPQRKELVAAALLEAVERDFPAWKDVRAEIEALSNDSDLRERLTNLYAEGWENAGDLKAAFNEYLKLTQIVTGSDDERFRRVGRVRARESRWLRGRFQDLYEKAAAADRAFMEQKISDKARTIVESGDVDQFKSFLDVFGRRREADPVRRALVEELNFKSDAARMEQQLLRLRRSNDAAYAGYSTAKLADMLIQMKRPRDAAHLVHDLKTRFAEVVCLNGETGRALVTNWTENKSVARAVRPAAAWPKSNFTVDKDDDPQPFGFGSSVQFPVEVAGRRNPAFRGWTFNYDMQQASLSSRDESGTPRWSVSVPQAGRGAMYGNHLTTHGHILVCSFGDHIMLLNTLDATASVRQLWHARLDENAVANANLRGARVGVFRQQTAAPGGLTRHTLLDQSRHPLGRIGPVADDFVCYQKGDVVYVVDLLTGKPFWTLDDVPRGARLFGNEDYIVVSPVDSGAARVLRAADGREVAVNPMPEEPEFVCASGTLVVWWTIAGDEGTLACTDLLTGKRLWKREYGPKSKLAIPSSEELSVMEPGGRFEILAINNGERRLSDMVHKAARLEQITVVRDAEGYILLTNAADELPGARSLGQSLGYPQVNGVVYAFDRKTGNRRWEADVSGQILEPGQPDDAPVLAFANILMEPVVAQPQGRLRRSTYSNRVLILDRRTGTRVFEDETEVATPRVTSLVDVRVNHKKHTVHIGLPGMGRTIVLKPTK